MIGSDYPAAMRLTSGDGREVVVDATTVLGVWWDGDERRTVIRVRAADAVGSLHVSEHSSAVLGAYLAAMTRQLAATEPAVLSSVLREQSSITSRARATMAPESRGLDDESARMAQGLPTPLTSGPPESDPDTEPEYPESWGDCQYEASTRG